MNVKDVKPGHLVAITHWVKVQEMTKEDGKPVMSVQNVADKGEFYVKGKELIEAAASADVFTSEKKVTKTQAAEILIGAYGKPFTVTFKKTGGQERTLRGRLLTPEPLMGRSMVQDLDISKGNNLRQVDHRTISCIIIDGVKHTVKTK